VTTRFSRVLVAALLAAPIGASVAVARAVESHAADALVSEGRQLFVTGCASCHGLDAGGRAGYGPSLVGAGAAAADFYLSTGRMPLDAPRDPPVRKPPAYDRGRIAALVAYVGSLGGPRPPAVGSMTHADIGAGLEAFSESCAGCHGILARGGIVTGAVAPSLLTATPRQIIEAIRIGPYLMPRFSERQIDRATARNIVAYVDYAKHPDDRGGWGIGHLGPVPEGMIAWLVGAAALLLTARLLGERAES
jgi:ubiquinol-cytochrome c reductase cytochrome c subunit